MKKIKLISAVALAGVLTLAGCGEKPHEHTFSAEWLSNDTQHWHAATCGCTDVVGSLGNHHDDNHDGKCDECDRIIGEVPVTPEVKSVNITGGVSKLANGEKVTLTAVVNVTGSLSVNATWSADNDCVSLSSTKGRSITVTAVKDGTVKIRATSEADTTKFKEISITVYTPDWSDADKALMIEALGEPLPFMGDGLTFSVETQEGQKALFGEAETYDCTAAVTALENGGYVVESLDFFGITFIDAVKEVGLKRIYVELIDMSAMEFGVELTAYTLQGMTEWPAAVVADAVGQYMDFEVETVPAIEAEAYFISEGYDGLVVECVNTTLTMNAYLEAIAATGWYVDDDPESIEYNGGYTCFSPNETIYMFVSGEGNFFSIEVAQALPRLEAYPAKYINSFVTNKIGSIFTIPALEGGNSYYYQEGKMYEDEDDEVGFDAATLYVDYNLKTADLKSYFELLEANGFEGVWVDETEEDDAGFIAEKGKICIEGTADTTYEEDYGKTELILTYYAVDADEIPFSLNKNSFELIEGGTATIVATPEAGFEGTFSFSSNKESVVTVNATTGELTAVAKGTAEITVTLTTTNEETFTRKVDVLVAEQATGVSLVLPEEILSGNAVVLSYTTTPEGSIAVGDPVYSILSGSEFAHIEDGKLIAEDEIEEEHTVEVKVVVGTLEDTKTITVAPKPEAIVDVISFKGYSTANADLTTLTSEHGVQLAFDKNQSNQPIYHAKSDSVRMYNNNKLTFTAPAGHTITGISFNETDYSDSKNGRASVSASVGAFSGSSWYGEASSVTLTLGSSGQFRFDEIAIELDGEGGDIPVGGDTAEDIMSEIAYYIFEDETQYKSDGEGGFYTAAIWGSTSEYDLLTAINEFVEYCLPESVCYVIDEPYLDIWEEDGTDGGFAEYCTEDGSIIVDVGTWEEKGNIILQVNVYDAE